MVTPPLTERTFAFEHVERSFVLHGAVAAAFPQTVVLVAQLSA
jgi:hypothetical protein